MHSKSPVASMVKDWYDADKPQSAPCNAFINRITALLKEAATRNIAVRSIQLSSKDKQNLWHLLDRFDENTKSLAHSKGIDQVITRLLGYPIVYGKHTGIV